MNWILFLRGVNVGGHGKLPMKELREKLLATAFCQQVDTYIQSGNLLLESKLSDSAEVVETFQKFIEQQFGFAPSVFAISPERLQAIARKNPYPEAEVEPKTLHLFFLNSIPDSSKLASLEQKRAPSEKFELNDDVLYLWAPDGIGRSKLAGSVERVLRVSCTARNWRTVDKMLSLAFSD